MTNNSQPSEEEVKKALNTLDNAEAKMYGKNPSCYIKISVAKIIAAALRQKQAEIEKMRDKIAALEAKLATVEAETWEKASRAIGGEFRVYFKAQAEKARPSLDRARFKEEYMEFDHFEPALDMKWLLCPACGKAINVYDKAVEEPLTFGGATATPETQTHWAIVKCRCRATAVKAYGKIIKMEAHGCFARKKKL